MLVFCVFLEGNYTILDSYGVRKHCFSGASLGPLWGLSGALFGPSLEPSLGLSEALRGSLGLSGASLGGSSVACLGASGGRFCCHSLWFLWEGKHDTLGARCVEPSEARLRAADGSMICVILVKASQESDGAGELQSAGSLLRGVKRYFVCIPLARFPFLLSQVSAFCVFLEGNPTLLTH